MNPEDFVKLNRYRVSYRVAPDTGVIHKDALAPSPQEAVDYLVEYFSRHPDLTVVGVAQTWNVVAGKVVEK